MEKDPPQVAAPKATAKKPAPAKGSAASRSTRTTTPASASASASARSGARSGTGRSREPAGQEKAPKRTRKRHLDESRAEMLERLSNPLISLHEAGVLLQVCSATVRRLANDGELPHSRTEGGQRRFRLRDVLRLADERNKRRSLSRAQVRALWQPPGRPAAPASAVAVPAGRLERARAEAARAQESRDRIAAVRARAERVQGSPDREASSPTSSRVGAPSPGAEAARALGPLRLGAARGLAPRPLAGAASPRRALEPQPPQEREEAPESKPRKER